MTGPVASWPPPTSTATRATPTMTARVAELRGELSARPKQLRTAKHLIGELAVERARHEVKAGAYDQLVAYSTRLEARRRFADAAATALIAHRPRLAVPAGAKLPKADLVDLLYRLLAELDADETSIDTHTRGTAP